MPATTATADSVEYLSILVPERVIAVSLHDLEILECITLDHDLDVSLRWTLVERRMVDESLRGRK